MRAFVIGSKELSCLILDALVEAGHEVMGVYSRDEEPGMRVWHTLGHRSLKAEAERHGIPHYESMKVNSAASLTLLQSLDLDIILSCFWSEIFKEPILNIPKLGVFNFHTAYLPKNRGSRPIPWAIIKGEPYAGITVHKMMTGVDNGPIVAQEKVVISATDTGETVYNKATEAGGKLAKKVVVDFADNSYTLTLQDEDQATYQPRGEPFGRQINPHWTEEQKDRFKRAFDFPPFAGALPQSAIYSQKKLVVSFVEIEGNMNIKDPNISLVSVLEISDSKRFSTNTHSGLHWQRVLINQMIPISAKRVGLLSPGLKLADHMPILDALSRRGYSVIANILNERGVDLGVFQPFRHVNGLLEIPVLDARKLTVTEVDELIKNFSEKAENAAHRAYLNILISVADQGKGMIENVSNLVGETNVHLATIDQVCNELDLRHE